MARPHIYGRHPATVIGHSLCMYVHGCCDVYSWAVYAHALLFDVAAMVLLWFGSGECSTPWLGVILSAFHNQIVSVRQPLFCNSRWPAL